MKLEVKQAAQLETIMDKLAGVLENRSLNDPLTVGLAKAYALCVLAYTHAEFKRVEI